MVQSARARLSVCGVFIPLFDVNPTKTRPVVTPLLLVINVVAWLLQLQVGLVVGRGAVLQHFGMVPAELFAEPSRGWTLVSSMFMHGSWAHLGGNLLFLHVFGDNVEEALGRWRFLAFYLVGGVLAAVTEAVVEPTSMVPMVGASGAIAAVLGGYLVLYPRAPIVVLNPLILPLPLLAFPAWLAIGMWFVLNLAGGFAALGMGHGASVAYFAHLGGFVAGLLAIRGCMAGRLCPAVDEWHGWRPAPRKRYEPGPRSSGVHRDPWFPPDR